MAVPLLDLLSQNIECVVGRHRHRRRLLRIFQRPNDNVATINTSNVKHDPVPLFVVDDAPRVSLVSVAAFNLKMLVITACVADSSEFGLLALGPILRTTWRQ